MLIGWKAVLCDGNRLFGNGLLDIRALQLTEALELSDEQIQYPIRGTDGDRRCGIARSRSGIGSIDRSHVSQQRPEQQQQREQQQQQREQQQQANR
jgi:hypothetical protein